MGLFQNMQTPEGTPIEPAALLLYQDFEKHILHSPHMQSGAGQQFYADSFPSTRL